MHDPASGFPRIHLPCTSVNRGIRLEGEENSRPSVGSHTFSDQFLRIIVALPTTDLRFLVAFEALVDLKELLDLAQVLLRQVLQGSYVRKARVVVGDGQHVVLIAFGVSYVQRSDRAGPHHAAGEGRIVGGYHNVQGVAAIGERGGHEAVVGGVADGARQHPVSHDDPEVGFVLVLVAAAYRDFYYGVDQLGSVISDRQSFKVSFHSELGICRNLGDLLFDLLKVRTLRARSEFIQTSQPATMPLVSILARSGSGGRASLWPAGQPPDCSPARR